MRYFNTQLNKFLYLDSIRATRADSLTDRRLLQRILAYSLRGFFDGFSFFTYREPHQIGRVVCSGGVVEGRHRNGGDFSAFAGELFAVLDGVSRDRFDVFHRSDEEEAALGRIDG